MLRLIKMYNDIEVINVSDLTTRKRYTTSIDIERLEDLKALSKVTKRPMSRLLDEAIEDLMLKYGSSTREEVEGWVSAIEDVVNRRANKDES